MDDIVIDVKNLSCLSGVRYLLKEITWQVKQGEQWVVFGRNGSGKTTLLSIIAGYKSHSTGALKVLGQNYNEENILRLRKNIGWISNSFFDKCYHHESVMNIVLSGKFASLGVEFDITNADMVRAIRLLHSVGLAHKIKASFDVLSKGERQNVLIARAFMNKPQILILDEPGTGLDVMARENLLQTIQKLAQKDKVTTIYVTHYPEEILPSFDKCLLLKNGAVYKQGLTEELLTSAEMSRFFESDVSVTKRDNRFEFVMTSNILDLSFAQEG